MLKEYLKKDLILLKEDAKNRNDLYKKIAGIYLEKGYVNPGFYDFLSERESKYPTGLQLQSYNVAIPHVDTKYVQHSFVSIITLEKSVIMKNMEDADTKLEVRVFFMLGLASDEEHLSVLKEVSKIIQQKDKIMQIQNATTADEVLHVIC